MGKIRPFIPGHDYSEPKSQSRREAEAASKLCGIRWSEIEKDLRSGKLKAYELCDPEVAKRYGG